MPVQALIQCISDFAEISSNPVFSVLPESGEVKYDHKYPEPVLSFSDAGLRAYYHCHSWSSPPDGEHGHFHIFVKTADEKWTHLAGLSMDSSGQPLQWFTVNHWVTGEEWRGPKEIFDSLAAVSENNDWELTEQWIWHMIHFYRPMLVALLDERDNHLNKLKLERGSDSLSQDRDIYILSSQSINLLDDIGKQIQGSLECCV